MRSSEKKNMPPGGGSVENLWGTKIQNTIFYPKNTFLISKSYSEHVSNVEKCRECVFEHQNTIWGQEMTFLEKIRRLPKKSSENLSPPWGGRGSLLRLRPGGKSSWGVKVFLLLTFTR